MPRASFASKDTVEVSLGIQEGVVEITKAETRVHQYPPNKNTGEQGEPFPCVQLTVLRCNESGERVDDTEIEEQLGLGKLDKWHPGKSDGPDDDDPDDMGDEVGAEGNCVYVMDATAKLNKKSKWVIFAASLEEKGFKSEILERGYMPDLVGMKLKVKSVPGTKIPGQIYKKDPINLVVEKILVFPYEKKGKAASKANGKPGVASTPAPKGEAKGEAKAGSEEMALKFLGETATDYTGKEIERKKLQTAVQTKLMRGHVPVGQHKGVIDLVKDDEWLRDAIENDASPIFGKLMVDFDADPQMVTFA